MKQSIFTKENKKTRNNFRRRIIKNIEKEIEKEKIEEIKIIKKPEKNKKKEIKK
jgi:hypothetical protein